MTNLKDFTEKAIGATIYIYILDGDPDELDKFYYIIQNIEEQDNGTYDIITTSDYKINVPSLDIINDVLDGKPYEIINVPGYKKILKCK